MDDLDKKIQQGIETYMRNKQFNYSKIQAHEHNGVDTVQIQQSNVLPSPLYAGFILENTNETFNIINISPSLNNITFMGIAYDSSSSPATKKATIYGKAYFKNLFSFTGSGTNISIGGATSFSLLQTFNSTYFDTSSLAKTRVNTGGTNLAYVEDDTATEVASLTINSFTGGVLSITSKVASNWIIKGTFILT